MIELKNDSLVCTFPETTTHEATLTISFMRTLRIPDDGKDYPLPPGLGRFSLVHVDDHSQLSLIHLRAERCPMCQHGIDYPD